MDVRVAKRYARALFSAAVQGNVVESVEADLDGIARVLEHNSEFAGFLHNPRVSREDKARILDTLFADRVTALTLRVMRLMLDKRRETEIPGLRAEFARLRRERGQVLYAQVTSSVELTDAQKTNLVSKLEAKSGKRVEAEYRLDSSLMGGIKVALGNYVLDGSIKGSLGRLRDTLRRDLLKQG